jgi:hypothetical protein
MAKTTTVVTKTRSIEEIVAEFVEVSDTGDLRLHQSRLAYEYIGSTEGTEAAELRDSFRKNANEALLRKHETILSDPAVTNLVNTWKYMLRANVDTSPETNEVAGDIAKAAFNFASQSFRKKEENYVIPAIEAIRNGADPVSVFTKETARLKADKTADQKRKAAEKERKEKEADKGITFDVLVATIALLTPENISTFTDEQKSTVRDLIAAASANLA